MLRPVLAALGGHVTHRSFFKVYLIFVAILFLLIVWIEMDDPSGSDIIDYLDYLTWMVAISGVIFYTYRKLVLSEWFWRVFLPAIIVWDIFVTVRELYGEPNLDDPSFMLFVVCFYSVILVPQYVGLYLYGYKFWPKAT